MLVVTCDTYPRAVAGNPIIIVPNAPTSMITLHNVKQLLENALYALWLTVALLCCHKSHASFAATSLWQQPRQRQLVPCFLP